MKIFNAITSIAIVEQAIKNSRYNTRTSSLNRKWIKFLKNKKLFDEYMIYLAVHDAVGIEPKTYRQIFNVCRNLDGKGIRFNRKDDYFKVISINWKEEFNSFFLETVKWYDFKNKLWFAKNGK